MPSFIVAADTPVRPDPDDNSSAIAQLKAGSIVERIRELSNWSKIADTKSGNSAILGWVPSVALKEAPAQRIKIYNEPLGEPKEIDGEIVEQLKAIASWRKVQVRLPDGTVVEGWVTDAATTGQPSSGGGGVAPQEPPPSAADDLVLGPNEVYRSALLKAESITGIDAAALAALINAEAAKTPSGQWDRNSKAGTSSAAGLTQFLNKSWIAHARTRMTLLNQVGKEKGYISAANDVVPGQEQKLLDLRFDPELSIVSAAELGNSNLNALIKDGLVDDDIGDDERARFIYLAHHEGLSGAKGFLRKTKSYTFSDLVTQVGNAKAQAYVNAAGGDTTQAYWNWLNDYMDSRIQPSKYRKAGSGVSAAGAGQGAQGLSQFTGAPIAVAELGGKPGLVKALQWRLFELGYLDPPADGAFGPVTQWALSEFCEGNGVSLGGGFTRDIALRLLTPTVPLPAIATTGTWFDKVTAYMAKQGYFICRHPDARNIVYLEGVDPDGRLNDDRPNVFNDLRIVFSIDKSGKPNFAGSIWEGTTEPGKAWTIRPMNPKGAARVAFNQYKAWVVGVHHRGQPAAHQALVQVAPISVYRDLNQDYKRPGDQIDTGLFAINQHWGYDAPKGDLGRTSAGCLVGRTKDGHRQFMALVKEDPRYKVNRGYRFLTAILPGDKVLA